MPLVALLFLVVPLSAAAGSRLRAALAARKPGGRRARIREGLADVTPRSSPRASFPDRLSSSSPVVF